MASHDVCGGDRAVVLPEARKNRSRADSMENEIPKLRPSHNESCLECTSCSLPVAAARESQTMVDNVVVVQLMVENPCSARPIDSQAPSAKKESRRLCHMIAAITGARSASAVTRRKVT